MRWRLSRWTSCDKLFIRIKRCPRKFRIFWYQSRINRLLIFWNCVGLKPQNHSLRETFNAGHFHICHNGCFFLFYVNPRYSNPRNLYLKVGFPCITFIGGQRWPWNFHQKIRNFLVHSLIYRTSFPPTQKFIKGIFGVQFPGNLFEFDIILNDFWRSTICAIQIQVS